jgi:starch phosphorylase
MSYSDFINAVSMKHKEVTISMFPNYTIHHITNGVHIPTWASKYHAKLFDKYCSGWREDSCKLNSISKASNEELLEAHSNAKTDLIKYINENNIIHCEPFKEDILTIGFARRFVQYKDAEMIFSNVDNLIRLGKKVQFVFAGKSHKKDFLGKHIIKRIIDKAKELADHISIAFLPNYDIDVSKLMISGCDLWLNTPIPNNEASGTSGMKAAANGCLHFSRLDGWAIEGYEKNGGGFPIDDYGDFIKDLEFKIIPNFYGDLKEIWADEMKLSIKNSGSYFNTHRMAKEYIKRAYKL